MCLFLVLCKEVWLCVAESGETPTLAEGNVEKGSRRRDSFY